MGDGLPHPAYLRYGSRCYALSLLILATRGRSFDLERLRAAVRVCEQCMLLPLPLLCGFCLMLSHGKSS